MNLYRNFYMSDGYKKNILQDVENVFEIQHRLYWKLKECEVLLTEVMDKVDSHVELVDLRDKIGNFLK